jgi:hypothetical protein
MLSSVRQIASTARGYFSPEARAKRLLERSRRVFDGMYDSYWSGISSNRDLAPDKELFDKVHRDGVAILPNYIDEETLGRLRAEIAALPGFAVGQYSGPTNFKNFPNDGICGLQITKDLPVAHRLVVDNDEMHGLANALYGPKVHLTGATVLSKYNPDRIDSAEAPHWDDWRVRLKTFLYVTDVGPENAPTIYLRGSQRGVPWRREKDYASRFLPTASAGGSWTPIEVLNFDKITCVGKAGTLVIFDALGLHAGSRLVSGNRIMLMAMYTTHLPYGFRPY